MRWYFLFLIVAIFVCGCNNLRSEEQSTGETTPQDSIQYWANTAKNDNSLSLEERLNLIDKAYNQNTTVTDRVKKAQNLSRISLAYFELDSANFRKTNKELIALSSAIGDHIAHGEAHWDLGAFLRRAQPDSSYYHYREAYGLFMDAELGDKKDYPGSMIYAMANLREGNKDYVGAEKEVIAAIETYKEHESKKSLYRCYNLLGIIQDGLNKYDKALEYYQKAKDYIPYSPENLQNGYRLQNQNNIASVYLRKGDHKKAFELYNEVESNASSQNDLSLLLRKGYPSKAISGFKSGGLNAKQALALIERSNRGLDSMNNTSDQARNRQFMAEILWDEKQTLPAISNALEAKKIAENTNNNDRLLNVLELLSQIDVGNSNVYAQQYFELNEKLMAEERSIQEKFARIQFETDEIEQNNIALARQQKIWIGIAIGLLLFGLGGIVIIGQRRANLRLRHESELQKSNKKVYNLMLAQQGKIEEGKKSVQKRISEELHDSVLGQMLGIRLILGGLNERDDEQAVEQRAELIEKLQEVEEEIRTMSHELSDAAYNQVDNFLLSLQELLRTFKKASKIEFELDYDKGVSWNTMDGDTKINVYRIIQETIKNSIKHAKCDLITISLGMDDEKLLLTISDNGQGFNTKNSKKGIGLKNIISRAEKINGTFKIESDEGKGTKTIVYFPVDTFSKTEKKRTETQGKQVEKSEI